MILFKSPQLFSSVGSSLILLFVSVTLSYAARPCPPLTILPGTVVTCDLPSENRTIDCLNDNAEIPRGTIARYKCERDGDLNVNFLKCRCKGKWSGLRIFNDFMGNCNISDYSVDGPAELNLTAREIRQLFGEDTSNAKDFQEDGAAYHNFYRKIHHSPPLKLNATLSQAAQRWAEEEVDQPSLKTEDWAKRWYSQNLYRITNPNIDSREAVRLATAAWYQPAYRYNWENPSGQSAFTQVVWKATTDIGIGVAQKGNRTVVVADYWPPGNVVVVNPDISDQYAWFRENVLPPNPTKEDSKSATVPSSSSRTSSLSTMELSTTSPSSN